MSEVTGLLTRQVIVMFLLMMVGLLITRTHMVDGRGIGQMSSICLYVATPATVIKSFLVAYDPQKVRAALVTFGMAALLTVLLLIILKVFFRRMSRIGQFASLMCNVGFLGIPLVQTTLGEEYVFYISMYVAWMTIMTFTVGIYLVSGDRSAMSVKKIFTNPAILSVLIGFVLYFLQVSLPTVLTQTIGYLANLNAPLAMLVLGGYMAAADVRAVLGDRETWLDLLVRLLISPLLMVALVHFLPADLDLIRPVLVIAASTPTATALAMLSQQYGSDYARGAGIVTLSTLFSMITMPLMLSLI